MLALIDVDKIRQRNFTCGIDASSAQAVVAPLVAKSLVA